MISAIGFNELLAIFCIALLLFGHKKVPELARALGKAIGEFKKSKKEVEVELKQLEEVKHA